MSNQYGFRSGKSTVDCLVPVDLIDEISKALDEECYAVSLFLDLSKAFDTVNHSITCNSCYQNLIYMVCGRQCKSVVYSPI